MTDKRTLPEVLASVGIEVSPADKVAVIVKRGKKVWVPSPAVRITPRGRARRPTLLATGPFDLVIDLAGPRLHERVVEEFFAVRPGGVYVTRLPRRRDGSLPPALLRWLKDIETAQASAAEPGGKSRSAKRQRDLWRLAKCMHDLVVTDRWLSAKNDVAAVMALADQEVEAYAALAHPLDAVIERRSAATLESKATVRYTHKPTVIDIPSAYDSPRLSMRTYGEAWSIPGQVLTRGLTVFPESFRRPTSARHRTSALDELSNNVFRAPTSAGPFLPGVWFALDSEIHNHFGHVLTEQLSHLWGAPQALAEFPDLQFLLHHRPGQPLAEWVVRILTAAGIPSDRLHIREGPVQVELLVATTPAYEIGKYVHPVMGSVYERVGAALARQCPPATPKPERVFFTRDSSRRRCTNREAVEQLFVRHGFTVLRPEILDLGAQFAIARQAQILAGFAGSSMFHMGFTERPTKCILIHSDTYHAHNEHQFAALRGHQLDLVVCEPDVPRPGGKFTGEAYRSSFAVDLNETEAVIGRVLDELKD